MKRVTVRLGDRSYSIVTSPLNQNFPAALKKLKFGSQSKILVVTSPHLKKAGHLSRLLKVLRKSNLKADVALMQDGEKNKNIQALTQLYRKGLSAGLDRKSLVIALGGGVITDLAGFFAATYMRGIRYVSVPTTLLAMVDAAIGGKTGVDLPEGKNLAGSFWQPSLVWIDPSILVTLPAREWKTGMAEVVKYGVIRDPKFYGWIEAKVRRQSWIKKWPLRDWEKTISTCAQIKADVVGADEKETPLKGGREILNFGHTIGHALEAATGYKSLTHGEAISIGMVAAGQMALEKKIWSTDAQLRLMSLLDALRLPLQCPRLTKNQWTLFWAAIKKDKKNVSGSLRFILPEKIGRVRVVSGIPASLVKSSLK